MGFFVAMAFSISLTQGLLALLCVLVLASPGSVGRHGAADARGATAPAADAWRDLASLRQHPLTPPFLTFAGLTLLSAAFSGNPGWSFWIARDLLRIATFYLVLLCTRDSRHAMRLWQAFLATLSLMAAYGLGQAYLCGTRPALVPAAWLSEVCTHAQRVRGPFSIYMTFGGVLFLGALFFLAYLANVPWRRAWWMLPGAVVTVAALAFTYSRNAWLGLAAGAFGLVLTAQRTLRIVAVLAAVLVGGSRRPAWTGGRARTIRREPGGSHPARPGGDVAIGSLHGRRPSPARRRPGGSPDLVSALPAPRGGPTEHRPSSQLRDSDRRGARTPGLHRLGLALGRLLPRGMEDPGRRRTGASMRRVLVCASLAGVAGFLVAGLFEHNFGDARGRDGRPLADGPAVDRGAGPGRVRGNRTPARRLGYRSDHVRGRCGRPARAATARVSVPRPRRVPRRRPLVRRDPRRARRPGGERPRRRGHRIPGRASESAAKRRIVGSSPEPSASTSAGIARGPNRESTRRAFQRQSSEDSGGIATSRSNEPCTLTGDQKSSRRRRRLVGRDGRPAPGPSLEPRRRARATGETLRGACRAARPRP